MRILVIHNRYRQRGGEDTTFEQEVELLNQTEEVKTLVFRNYSGMRGALQFLISVWNFASAYKIKSLIREFQPEIVHVHNWHFAIGPLVIRSVHKLKIPIVLTVQNYRLLCPSATLLYKDILFLDSIQSSFPWKAIRRKVYRNSFSQTFWLALIIWFHKKIGTWNMADRYILQTDLAKSVFISSSLGVEQTKFTIKTNFIEDPQITPKNREDFFLYIGRLSGEKGLEVLLETFRSTKKNLYIGGDGPLKENVINACKENSHIHYLGLLDGYQVRDLMCRCTALIFPSIWYEGMPLTLIEAFAVGTPVIASNMGAMSSMIINGYNGLHFKAGNIGSLSEKLIFWESLSVENKKTFSVHARASYETFYTPEKNREKLSAIYQSIIKNKPERKINTLPES